MIKNIALLLFFCGLLSNTKADTTVLNFNILHKNKVVGSLVATKVINGDIISYHSFTQIQTKIITTVDLKYDYNVTFNSDKLFKSNVSILLNGKSLAETSTLFRNGEYLVNKNKKVLKLQDSIVYSTVLLYFKEPINVKECYSEQDGSFNTLVSLGNHKYKKINSKGNENVYVYKNGVLYEATIDGGLINFVIQLKK
ncbi:hypothetical protein AX016_3009 [Cellulophaga sp. RHA19]|uniref:DUF6134 family protein n=1 Tax=Cellulophaga sp. RHA19 TaxID=1798237 RepID=UPI000C2B7175|nr:DUF6134 family protein [Cellulophaga sp. RHA19]PKB44787.1 hypothetical protein AX016_3009 [Cellulophaga sp. RHA19]